MQDRQAALERQVSHLVDKDAVIQPELPARCIPPLFSGGDIYSKRFVRLSRPPAGMSMLPVRLLSSPPRLLATFPSSKALQLKRKVLRQPHAAARNLRRMHIGYGLCLSATPCCQSAHPH